MAGKRANGPTIDVYCAGVLASRPGEPLARALRIDRPGNVNFVETIAGADVVADILGKSNYTVATASGPVQVGYPKSGRKFYHWHKEPFIPVEFSVAAYRFGHSMVRPEYDLNTLVVNLPIFKADPVGPLDDLRGFRERPARWLIEWHRFFEFAGSPEDELQRARLIDAKLAPGLATLPPSVVRPPITPNNPQSLAERNLKRGKALGLPCGQDVAQAMNLPDNLILSAAQLDLPDNLSATFAERTPLWYYILKEAEVLTEGKRLGPVGGRIVAEVLIGLLEGDPFSYLQVEPSWTPTDGQFGARVENGNVVFGLAELIAHSGAII